jgi:hypothetical protein
MKLDDRAGGHLECVEDGDRCERPAGGIDDDGGALVDRLVNPFDHAFFAVGLAELDRPVCGRLPAHRLDFGQRRLAINLGLALAEAIEIGTVEHVKWFDV